jgi:hypothetical protein
MTEYDTVFAAREEMQLEKLSIPKLEELVSALKSNAEFSWEPIA